MNLQTATTAPDTEQRLVVLLASGNQDGGKRATLAFSAACSAVAMGIECIVFLVGDGAHWAYAGNDADVVAQGFPPLSELIAEFHETGGRMYLCSACDRVCFPPTEALSQPRRTEVTPMGFAALWAEVGQANSVTF